MIKKLSIVIMAALILGCTSSSNESSNQDSGLIPLEKVEGSAYISDEIHSNITSKRRGKMNKLQADGPAWFSFRLEKSFQELQIIISNNTGSTDFIWPVEDILGSNEGNQDDSADVNVDVLITAEKVEIFFNENIRFSFPDDLTATNNSIEVYLDGELQNLPGILYDIGL
ncbi:hypothetical protein [Ekhidna sp.]|uniref:hypothetical protein n=1 Tax=Ekhidna sp. TaxID=2608089 RepID=UPI003CCB9EC4